jgi:hypothetical protein
VIVTLRSLDTMCLDVLEELRRRTIASKGDPGAEVMYAESFRRVSDTRVGVERIRKVTSDTISFLVSEHDWYCGTNYFPQS